MQPAFEPQQAVIKPFHFTKILSQVKFYRSSLKFYYFRLTFIRCMLKPDHGNLTTHHFCSPSDHILIAMIFKSTCNKEKAACSDKETDCGDPIIVEMVK